MAETNEKIATATGLSRSTVDRILAAHVEFLFAVGLAHGDEQDEARAQALRERLPDLLRQKVVNGMGSQSNPVTFELEATIVQLISSEPARNVVAVLAAHGEITGIVDQHYTAAYRTWAAKWVE